MDVEEVNVLCDQLKQKTINMEKELVCYMRAKNCPVAFSVFKTYLPEGGKEALK